MKFCVLLFLVLIHGGLFTNINNLQNENSFNITNSDTENIEKLITTTIETANFKIINDSLITTAENDNANIINNEHTSADIINKNGIKENSILKSETTETQNFTPTENFSTKQERENDTTTTETENFISTITNILNNNTSESLSTTELIETNIPESISPPENITTISPTPSNEFDTENISTTSTTEEEIIITESISTPESFTSENIITSQTPPIKIENDNFTTPSTENFNYATTSTPKVEENAESTTEIYTAATDHVFYSQGNTDGEDTTTTTEGVTSEDPHPCDELGEILNLNIVPYEFKLLVTWTNSKPDCTNYQYFIKWESSTEINNSTTEQTKYEINNLNACEKYTVSVSYINNDLEPISISSETLEAIFPVENLNPNFNEKEKTLLVTWDIAKNVEKCHRSTIIQTVIQDMPILLEQPASNNQIKFIEVNSCNNYIISVKAKSDKKESEERITEFTKPTVNDPPIYNKYKLEIQDDFVLTKWSFGKIICQPENFTVSCISEDKTSIIDTQGEMDVENNELTANITNIEPYLTYTCTGEITNSAGTSISEPIEFKTNSKPPSVPGSIKTSEAENNLLYIHWTPPDKWNGNPESYELTIQYLGLNYKLVEGCKEEKPPIFSKSLNATDNEFMYDNIIPAAKYKISLAAESDGGWSEKQTENFLSRPDIPEAPVNLHTEILHLDPDSSKYNVSLKVLWETPCKMNGILTQYSVTLCDNNKTCSSNSVDAEENKYYNTLFSSLKPQQKYEVRVWAKNGNEFDGNISQKILDSPAGIPNKINEANIVEPNHSITKEPWKSAIVYISNNIFDTSNGDIKYYSIVVGTEYCAENPKFGIYDYMIDTTWPEIKSANSSCSGNSRAYEATQKKWNPLNIKSQDLYRFTLGEDENCTSIDCNKPLTPSTKYFVKIRGFTMHGYMDTKLLGFETDPYDDVPVGLIVGLIVGILAIAFIIAAVLFYTKGRLNFKNWSRGSSGSQFSPAPLPVPLKKFVSHYEKMIENSGKIKNEFQLLSTISSDVTLSTKTALLPMNKKKNRYINILPYDQTRVKLEVNETNSTDYINASYIKGYSGSIEFIASQGPTEQTCSAYWQMILEQNVTLIVMLTQFVELGKEKCYKYFPDVKEELVLSNETCIKTLEETLFDTYYKRVIQIKRKDSDIIGKKVTHLQFIQWPDFGVPKELNKILQFCELVREIKRSERGLTLVHCSAGVGRTGTLIAVDILQQSIKDKRKVDIFGTVLNLRKQRMSMVQSEKQYEFLYRMTYFIINNKISPVSTKDTMLSISESDML